MGAESGPIIPPIHGTKREGALGVELGLQSGDLAGYK
jgi:hypothetical protein